MLDHLPLPVTAVLSRLDAAGHEAYLCGGCVRDSLMGLSPTDYDITTSALPDEVKRALEGILVLETGIRHGTVTALSGGMPVEITTYRIDGPYLDGRHPEGVSFTRSLQEDLARRDFTINAMAFHPGSGLKDPFGGRQDIADGLIRAVGDPELRFEEDALRILRALRFSSVLGFKVEEGTAKALRRGRGRLSLISRERISSELLKLLCGRFAGDVLRAFPEVICEVIPELSDEIGFPQNHPYHCYDVWNHTVKSVELIEPDPALRLAMLLHDLGKPACHSIGEDGVDHFFGHQKAGAEMARQVLQRLRIPGDMAGLVCSLVLYHDVDILPEKRAVHRSLSRFGKELFFSLLSVKEADIGAQAMDTRRRLGQIAGIRQTALRLLDEGVCLSRADLAIDGRDLTAIGIDEGRRIGWILGRLLELVQEGQCSNTPDALLEAARRLFQENGGQL